MAVDVYDTPAKQAQFLQDQLVLFVTGSEFEGGDDQYRSLRTELLRVCPRDLIPGFVVDSRDTSAVWQYIKRRLKTYAERRTFIWEAFRPLLDGLEAEDFQPGTQPITAMLTSLNEDTVRSVWQKALDRRDADPEGAITAARTLLESTCKIILDDLSIPYPDDADPGRLWALCAEQLSLSPGQHSELVFKSILGNCQSIVNNLASIRNKVGDAHGKGKKAVRPKKRHAELGVNLAGTMCAFLVSTWLERKGHPRS